MSRPAWCRPLRAVSLLLLVLLLVSATGTTAHQPTTRTFDTSSAGLATVFEAGVGMGAGDIGPYFHDDALVAGVEVVDCTLENRSETRCYQLLVSSQPDALSVTGPFCPSTVTDEHGIFTWGGETPGLYALNKEFWEMVTALGYSFVNEDGTTNVADPGFGNPGRGNVCLEATPDDSYTLKMLTPVTPEDPDAPTQ